MCNGNTLSLSYNTGKYRNEQYIATGEIAKYPLHTVGKGAVRAVAAACSVSTATVASTRLVK